MSWIYLILAIIFEVSGTTFMKQSKGFSDFKYAIVMMVFYILSLSMLTLALKKIDIGVAYAIWSAVGIVLIVTIGILVFKEPVNISKILCILLIIVGVVGLNLTSKVH
ncbi:small multidrug resistance pump [Clostridium acetobutylicum]|uniref:Membrane transporters of cations and cationic drugs n=1 Tax=Clostridium acetobutylicum (strain ATCC 824 / DSM 792 / JCM 1419 / IAM 19013 / LMG 5710 / NBRC 13948 / NRRL B-527 / VKM B-1787 / 2291 / W) TaxID=272562 RepID=Q97D16_CLOAB|nr:MULTISPECIES: multidrug efflux SMR transporter [Clostridium]AAK81588.1 Membrane transporters of cations and cationic drugs [Clostridium acetobutylicum ATCC 824]ADZ22710.1 Membrane transporter of cations and cationic drugs [Clostridium acetobutylicum EA 2018]AEI34152.1 membrane transporter [Clostridium acetobutylicum DSM 1731]AWV80738.1 QacE family quaternary ammonium compound efflux SMR transporter [Clostridium acetobutylicum]KHD35463.1 membrane protein [Clostridium acetobutylicum]